MNLETKLLELIGTHKLELEQHEHGFKISTPKGFIIKQDEIYDFKDQNFKKEFCKIIDESEASCQFGYNLDNIIIFK
jgi:hypothetical protein